MKIELEYPFDNCIGYKNYHSIEGRFMVNIIYHSGKRTTTSYARYLMSVHKGRLLERSEQVDHIDGNKQNDVIENLQILTVKENNIKSVKERGLEAKDIELVCPQCSVIFYRSKNRVNFKINQGKKPCCSRKCGGKYSHTN